MVQNPITTSSYEHAQNFELQPSWAFLDKRQEGKLLQIKLNSECNLRLVKQKVVHIQGKYVYLNVHTCIHLKMAAEGLTFSCITLYYMFFFVLQADVQSLVVKLCHSFVLSVTQKITFCLPYNDIYKCLYKPLTLLDIILPIICCFIFVTCYI